MVLRILPNQNTYDHTWVPPSLASWLQIMCIVSGVNLMMKRFWSFSTDCVISELSQRNYPKRIGVTNCRIRRPPLSLFWIAFGMSRISYQRDTGWSIWSSHRAVVWGRRVSHASVTRIINYVPTLLSPGPPCRNISSLTHSRSQLSRNSKGSA